MFAPLGRRDGTKSKAMTYLTVESQVTVFCSFRCDLSAALEEKKNTKTGLAKTERENLIH